MITIGKVFEVEAAIKQISGLTAGKLGYGLARNLIRLKEIVDPAREQCKTEVQEVQKYLQESAPLQTQQKNALKEKLSDEHKMELQRIEDTQEDLLKEETTVDWYKIKLAAIPGMKDDDAPEKGVLPLAYLSLFLEVGMIDDSEEEVPKLRSVNNEKG